MKICLRCKVEQPITNYHKQKQKKDGLNPYCKTCRADDRKRMYWQNIEYQKEYQAKPEVKLRRLERDFKRKYGISLEEYDTLYDKQEGRCAICSEIKDERLNVDHNHKTGEVRGLLCTACNRGLGMLQDSPETVQKALEYLVRFGHYGN